MDRHQHQHTRSTSGSFRINVNSRPTNSPPTSPSTTTSTSRPRQKRSHGILLRESAYEMAHDVYLWLSGRVSNNRRSGPRRWTVLVGLVGLVYVWQLLSSDRDSGAGTGWISRASGRYVDDGEIPRVDRAALDKLRLLALHLGGDDDDDDEGDDNEGRPDSVEFPADSPVVGAVKYAQVPPTRDDAPPLVAEMPSVLKPDPMAPVVNDKVPAHILDAEVCPEREGEPCSFLVPAWLGEQETKAQQHLHQLGMLAMALNRTLVLPNVQKSRLGTCFANPFSFYYESTSLNDLGIPTISQADFASWSVRRDPPASAQVVSMVTAQKTYTTGAIEIDSISDPTAVPGKPTRNLCLRAPRTRLDFSNYSPMAIIPPEGYHKNEASRIAFGESAVNTLKSESVALSSSRLEVSERGHVSLPNVYAFNYELRFPMMVPAVVTALNPSVEDYPPLPFAHFQYASTWTELAELVVENLAPFIAIHWRTETLTPNNLAPCAQSLIRKLVKLKQRYPEITNVYLATDYPIEDLLAEKKSGSSDTAAARSVPHSGTFAKVVTEQHHKAFRRFLSDFERQAKGLRLTTFAQEQARLEVPPRLKERLGLDVEAAEGQDDGEPVGLEALDSGLYGILDKEIATRAEVFLTGVPGVGSSTVGACAKLSSFTNQLVEAREARRLKQALEMGGGARAGGRGEEEGLGDDDVDVEAGQETERVKGRLWNGASHWALKGETDD